MKNDNVVTKIIRFLVMTNQNRIKPFETQSIKFINNKYLMSHAVVAVQALLLLFGLGNFTHVQAAELIQSDVNPGKCFHKRDRGWSNGNPIHIWDCSAGGDENKAWNFDADTNYIRSATNPDKCLHKRNRGWRNGNPIHVWDCEGGNAENKTWRFDVDTGYIRSATNPDKCLHKREGGWANGNPIHVWNCDAGTNEMKTWDLAPYLYITPSCAQIDTLGPLFSPQVQERLNSELSGYSHRISRRKTLLINYVSSVRVSSCRLIIDLNVTLQRRIRRNAHGTVRLSSQVRSISETSACLSEISVDDVDVSNTAILGEWVYGLVANSVIPNNRCFAIDIRM